MCKQLLILVLNCPCDSEDVFLLRQRDVGGQGWMSMSVVWQLPRCSPQSNIIFSHFYDAHQQTPLRQNQKIKYLTNPRQENYPSEIGIDHIQW